MIKDEPAHMLWVHSGGTDPETGEPTIASRMRLERAAQWHDRYPGSTLVISGEETRKSGPGDQGGKLLAWMRDHHPDVFATALPGSRMEAYRNIAGNLPQLPAGSMVVFINDDAHTSRYRWEFARENPEAARRMAYDDLRVMDDPAYGAAYGMSYIAGYNALAWMRAFVKDVGVCQTALFVLDRSFNAPQKGLKAIIAKAVEKRLRRDLGGKNGGMGGEGR